MRVLFISKKSKGISWSDSIERLRNDLSKQDSIQLSSFEIDTTDLISYWENKKRLEKVLNEGEYELIFVNHIICSWPILGLIKNFEGISILALHEGEPVLGYSHLVKNLFKIPLKQWIRYPHFWNSFPLGFFDKIFILNKKQILFNRYREKYIQANFLGVDIERFHPNDSFKKIETGFFPFGEERREKGFEIAKETMNHFPDLELKRGGNIPNVDMPEVYRACQFLILPSIYETYSLAILEAMASNLYVIVSRAIGLVDNLLGKYSSTELAEYGVFTCERNPASFIAGIEQMLNYQKNGLPPRTKELLVKEGYASMDIAKGVAKKFEELVYAKS